MNDLSNISEAQGKSDSGAVCLHEWFESQVLATPDAKAVTYEGQTWSYCELNRRANAIARRLIAQGVCAGDVVGLCLERNGDLIPSLLGILKAGAAYRLTYYPAERLQFILSDCAATAVVSTSRLAASLGIDAQKLVDLDELHASGALTENALDANPVSGVTSDQLAYVIYTSGSTGQPKGVLVSHANVTRLFTATQHWFQFSAGDTWTMFHSYAFDWEMGGTAFGDYLIVVPLPSRSTATFYRSVGTTSQRWSTSSFARCERDERLHADCFWRYGSLFFGGKL